MNNKTREHLDVVALGGNAILPAGQAGTFEEQVRVTRVATDEIAALLGKGRRVVITHGNGPIVGNIVIRNEAAQDQIPPMPLDVCGADSQGGVGYMIQRTLRNALITAELPLEVAAIVTQVVVDPNDSAFDNPTKPIGPFYSAEEATRLGADRGWAIREDSNRGYRRVVPSPVPHDVVEKRVIATLVDDGVIVIALGGGGVPVFWFEDRYKGCDAVVDKDLASALLGNELGAERLIIITNVDAVYRRFGTDAQEVLRNVSVDEIKGMYDAGEFPVGSMGEKILAAIRFIEGGGRSVLICKPGELAATVAGEAGTTIRGE